MDFHTDFPDYFRNFGFNPALRQKFALFMFFVQKFSVHVWETVIYKVRYRIACFTLQCKELVFVKIVSEVHLYCKGP